MTAAERIKQIAYRIIIISCKIASFPYDQRIKNKYAQNINNHPSNQWENKPGNEQQYPTKRKMNNLSCIPIKTNR